MRGEIGLPVAVVAVVSMMVLPLPGAVLDLFLAGNLALSVVLLLNAVRLSQPERFTALPSILLLATVYRLSLNVSTTRMLLATGDAPEIVAAFGKFVVGGNVIAGLVVFAVITLVQFLVVAKGAERIAEVSARFTLDALPGRQMAIDADVRTGIITIEEAKERRMDLQREARLYGALDGAMKFVKGDAIAGLCITVLNITAGIALGVVAHKLSLEEAVERYTIFTVGDGLVSQIPALFVAVAAAIAVTRVSDGEGSNLGGDLAKQLCREPQVMFAGGFMLVMLAILPGFPGMPLLVAAAVCLLVWLKMRHPETENTEVNDVSVHYKPGARVALRLGRLNAASLLNSVEWNQGILTLREKFFSKWGVLLPAPVIEMREKEEGPAEFLIGGVCTREIQFEPGNLLGFLENIGQVAEEQLLELVDDTMTRELLELYDPMLGDMVNAVVPEHLSVTGLTRLFRALLLEGVPLTEVRAIFQAIAEFQFRKDIRDDSALTASVRRALRRSITTLAESEKGVIHAFVLAPDIDKAIGSSVLANLPLPLELLNHLAEQVQRARSECGKRVVLLSTQFSRAVLGEALAVPRLGCLVVAVEELLPDAKLIVQGLLGLSPELAKEGAVCP